MKKWMMHQCDICGHNVTAGDACANCEGSGCDQTLSGMCDECNGTGVSCYYNVCSECGEYNSKGRYTFIGMFFYVIFLMFGCVFSILFFLFVIFGTLYLCSLLW